MKPPKKFPKKINGFGFCTVCQEWQATVPFRHEGIWWNLCQYGWEDYWLNTDTLQDDLLIGNV